MTTTSTSVSEQLPADCDCPLCTEVRLKMQLQIVDMIEYQADGALGDAMNLLDHLERHNKHLVMDLLITAGALSHARGSDFHKRLKRVRARLRAWSNGDPWATPQKGHDPWAVSDEPPF